jgi:agmatine deiminase
MRMGIFRRGLLTGEMVKSESSNVKKEFPKDQAYRIPAEWEKHEATWLGWPHNKEDWPGKIAPIYWVYGEIAKKISEGENVNIVVESNEHQQKAIKVLKDVGADLNNVEFFILKTDRGWMRDSGPAFVKNSSGEVVLINFNFNGWAKYNNYKKDKKLPGFIGKKFGMEKFIALHKGKEVCLEGGSIDINGKGTLITTEECLMDQETQVRNPGFNKKDYEEVFKKYLGITNVLWFGKGITGDDTHGHVDDLCRFVKEDTVVLVQERNTADSNYKLLRENYERAENMVLENGSRLNVIYLPMPDSVIFRGERLPASYANFYISNKYVLVPTFNDPKDRIALGVLSEVFKDRIVVGIHSGDLIWGLGTIHCLTREQPEIS